MLAMARPIVHHRTADFEKIFREAAEGLQWLYQTKQPVLMLSGSGTLAMEAAVVNTMKRGEKALCVVGGKFGERWRNICKAYGLDFVSLDVEWGRAVDPAAVEKALDADDRITAVFSQANESSTGVRHPVEEIAASRRIASASSTSSTPSRRSAPSTCRWTPPASTCCSPARRRRSCCRPARRTSRSPTKRGRVPSRPICRASTATSSARKKRKPAARRRGLRPSRSPSASSRRCA